MDNSRGKYGQAKRSQKSVRANSTETGNRKRLCIAEHKVCLMKLQICSMLCIYTLRRLDFIINLGLEIKLQTRMRQLIARYQC